jgi:superfamily II DNA or RNA helicase
MSALVRLRDYQAAAIREIYTKWDAGITRPAVVLPTGAGKTVVFTHLAEQFLKANPGKRVLILAHTDELVQQAKNKMHEVAPNRVVGVVKAAQNEVHAEIVVASVQSLRGNARRDKIKAVGLVIVDECHHASARTYMNILEHYGAIPPEGWSPGVDPMFDNGGFGTHEGDWHPSCLAVGFTATLVRADDKKLSDVWQDVAFRLSIAFMIRAGYLLDVKGKRVEVPKLDLKQVHTSGGDYKEGELADALVEAMAPEIVAKAYLEHASDRKGIGFAPTVASAYVFSEAFQALGITSEVVHGGLERQERRDILLRLKSGETQVCWSVMALTEGFDEPTVSCAIMARPTKSSGLWQQMVGRVLRPDLSLPPAERGHALLLDVTGVSRLHGLQSLVDLSARDDLPEDVSEDLSLLELEDLILEEEVETEGSGPEPAEYYMGPAATAEFDPLGRDSDRTWGRTPDGHYYLPCGKNGYVFLIESLNGDPGSYDLVWCANERDGAARMTEHTAVHFEMGVAWGEEMAIELGGFGAKTLTAKKAKWRNEPATNKAQVWKVRQVPGWGGAKIRTEREDPNDQFSEVKRYWIAETGETLTKGMASEIIDAHAAAQRIDPLVRAVKASLR